MAYAKQGQEGKTRLERFQDTIQDFGHFLYHKNEDDQITIMGRNGASWAKIALFFLVFYGCLAGFFAAMLNIFLTTVPPREDGPKMTSYLKDKLGLIPLPTDVLDVKDVPVHVTVDKINKFLEPYKKANTSDKYQSNCTDESRDKGSLPCAMDLTTLGECYSEEDKFDYGYKDGKPCIFFKMNRVYGWKPDPKDGKDYVELTCKFENGENNDKLHVLPADKPGFLANFYPFYSEENWLAPIAAVKVNDTVTGVVLCEVIANNIERSDTYRLNRGATGRVRIEIFKK